MHLVLFAGDVVVSSVWVPVGPSSSSLVGINSPSALVELLGVCSESALVMLVGECDAVLSACLIFLCCVSLVFLHVPVPVVSGLFGALGMDCR